MTSQRTSRGGRINYTDPLSAYGRAIIDHFHAEVAEKYWKKDPIKLPPDTPDVITLASVQGGDFGRISNFQGPIRIPCPRETNSSKVGIIGAGVGGLYAGMMLESLGIDYDIFEATDRVGGRLYTHKFSGEEHDYFDAGAMRYPDIPIMKRTFDLFDKLKQEAGLSLIPYIFESPNSMLCFNDVLMTRASSTDDPTHWAIRNIPSRFAQAGSSALLDNVLDPFVKQLAEDLKREDKQGWKLMMDYDQYSTRAYMSANRSDVRPELDELSLMPYPTPVVDWLETFEDSTGAYDRALSETVLDRLAFSFPQEKVEWKCVEGGSQGIAEKMAGLLKNSPKTQHRVTGIAVRNFDSQSGQGWAEATVELTFANPQLQSQPYGHVISTVPLGCLRAMDLTQASLTPDHNTALRMLRYGPSIKIGVKFKTSWWTDASEMSKYQQAPYGPIVGGQSSTDRMIRTVVYPSYGETQGKRSTVLIVSYCWTEDADRWSTLFGDATDAQVKEIVLRDLVAVHGFSQKGHQFLEDQWEGSYKWSWAAQPEFMGAFGLFGPGQFSYIYKHMTQPAAYGRLHFAGEALSTRHAWVAGALDASWRAVYGILYTSYPEKLDQFKELWGLDEDWTGEMINEHVRCSLVAEGVKDVKGMA